MRVNATMRKTVPGPLRRNQTDAASSDSQRRMTMNSLKSRRVCVRARARVCMCVRGHLLNLRKGLL